MPRSRCRVGDCTWTALGTDAQLDVAFERHYRDAHAKGVAGAVDKGVSRATRHPRNVSEV